MIVLSALPKTLFSRLLVIFTLIIIFPCNTFSNSESEQYLDELSFYSLEEEFMNTEVITAGRKVQKFLEASSTISVITAEDIKKSGATQVSEALMMIPGVNLGYAHAAYPAAGGIRGFSKLPANKIILLVNGSPWTMVAYAIPWLSLLPISLDQIERVEVLRGPGSSLYGANAMFGVINIITKKPEDMAGGHLSIIRGEWFTRIANASYGGSFTDDIHYLLSTGFDTMDHPGYISWQQDPMKEYWHANLRVDSKITDESNLSIFGSYLSPETMDTIQESTGPLDWGGMDSYNLQATYHLNDPNITLKGFINEMGESEGWAMGDTYLKYKQGSRGIDFQHVWEEFKNNSLVWGFNLNYEYIDGQATGKKKEHSTHGFFLDDTQSLYDSDNFDMAINGGIRIDNHPNTGESLSHRLSLMCTAFENHHFRWTWGSSYRNPDFIEFYYSRKSLYAKANSKAGTPDIYLHVFGQKENDPESAKTYEFAYNGQITPNWYIGANLFYTEIKDFVYFVPKQNALYFDADLGGAVIPTPFMNIGGAKQYGAELEMKLRLTNFLTGTLNYTYIDQKEKDDNVKQLLVMTPKHVANGELKANFQNGFSFSISCHYKDSTEWRQYTWSSPKKNTIAGGVADDYLIVNTRFGFQFEHSMGNVEVGIAALNLLDEPFVDYPLDNSNLSRRVTLYMSLDF